jgi:hypothetical protein
MPRVCFDSPSWTLRLAANNVKLFIAVVLSSGLDRDSKAGTGIHEQLTYLFQTFRQ